MATLQSFLVCFILAASFVVTPTSAQLSATFYDQVCPKALPKIRKIVRKAISNEPRMGASLLRLHFHDCFVNGCDGSVLLDDTSTFTGEKTAPPNAGSIRGFDVVDDIKAAVEKACNKTVVSCADILAVAARDSIEILGGPLYKVQLGRRDATTASTNDVNTDLPPPTFSFSQLLSNFQSHGLDLTDLVVLSATHTIGQARCTAFRDRIYNETNIDASFAASAQANCPRTGGDNNLHGLDVTPTKFEISYFSSLLVSKGLLHSDQELFKGDGSDSDKLVQKYSSSQSDFFADLSASMIKMGNIKPLTGTAGEVRVNCRKIN